MIVQDGRPGDRGLLLGLCILLLGILVGTFLTDPISLISNYVQGQRSSSTVAPTRQPPSPVPGGEHTNDLATLNIDLSEESARLLQETRDRALKQFIMTDETKVWVPAMVTIGGKDASAQLRIKGDVTDHIDTDKWSFRISLDNTTLLGMSTFSIHHPKTRGYLWEWLIVEAAKREGLLAPRTLFVNVRINHRPNGIYLLSEHFAKELLESQGRREGPIVCFAEDTCWLTQQRHHTFLQKSEPVPKSIRPALGPLRAAVRGFDERGMAKVDSLNRQLQIAMNQMRDLALLMNAGDSTESKYSQLRALHQLRQKTVDDLFDTDKLAQAHALMSLFGVEHGLIWINQRYYYNPITCRLEPVLFDCVEGPYFPPSDLAVYSSHAKVFAESRNYYDSFFAHLAKLADPRYLDQLLDAVAKDMEKYESALRAEQLLPPDLGGPSLFNNLRARQIFLQKAILPPSPALFECWSETGKDPEASNLLVHAWCTTRVPVAVKGFRFSNGAFVKARSCLEENGAGGRPNAAGEVILPHDGQPVVFRFPADKRLAGLQDVQDIKKAIRTGTDKDQRVKMEVFAVFRPIAAAAYTESLMDIRKMDPAWRNDAGRPPAPSLADALKAHPFLVYDPETRRLEATRGTWIVEGDLVVPEAVPLYLGPGVTLKFPPGSILTTTGPVIFEGTETDPVRLMPLNPDRGWSGIAVINAKDDSRWDWTTVSGTTGIDRGGWILTGGITFYRSAVHLKNARIENSTAEDALNAISGRVSIELTTIAKTSSDAFDGDFVSCTVDRSFFDQCGGDGIDLSGSVATIENCRFNEIGDKAMSIGEATTAQITDCSVNGAMLGAAAKDASRATVQGLVLQNVRNYALAAYTKKDAYGPASITATRLSFVDPCHREHLVQTGSSIVVDDRSVPARDLDVDRLYAEGVLGN